MKAMPLVSIVIPVYNAERYLEDNIRCVLNQTYKNIEVMYICDGCTDESVSILKKYSYDNRIKIINRHANWGAAKTRNQGAEQIHGEWLIFWDADDLMNENAIEKMLNAAFVHNADLVICNYGDVCEKSDTTDSRLFEKLKLKLPDYPVFENNREVYDLTDMMVCNAPYNKMVRKTLYEKNGLYFQDIKNCNDVYYSVSVFCYAKKIAYIEDKLYWYRSNAENSISSKRKIEDNYLLEALKLVRKLILQLKYNQQVFDQYAYCQIMSYRETSIFSRIMSTYKKEFEVSWNLSFDKNILYCPADDRQIKGKKIVLYGAGCVGRDYYKSLDSVAEVIAWIDSNCKANGILPVEDIKRLQYDYVIIATLSDYYASQMKTTLLTYGVDEEKIISTYPGHI